VYVSVVSDYKLKTGRSRFDFRQRRKGISSNICLQTGSGAHPAFRKMGTGASKARTGRGADHSPHLVQGHE
jgi:hypothetical protein